VNVTENPSKTNFHTKTNTVILMAEFTPGF
jgi:hypothetical protein